MSDRHQPVGIGQSQVKQDNINGMSCEIRLGVCQTFDVGQIEGTRAMVVNHHADDARLFRVILDQENGLVWAFSHRLHLGTSNLALLAFA
jgi:hypothetical protein